MMVYCDSGHFLLFVSFYVFMLFGSSGMVILILSEANKGFRYIFSEMLQVFKAQISHHFLAGPLFKTIFDL